MIYNVKGTLTYTDPTFAVVDCGGVGFKCYISMTTLRELPSVGSEVNLYTYMSVREDALDLFGFFEIDELEAFNYEEFKANGFKVNKLGDYDLTLDFDKKPE